MTAPLFSVIIPTYDRPHLLGQALTSVLSQTVDDYECLVVDDASPTPIKLDHPRIRVVRRPENGGPAAARNTGLSQACGRYVVFLDDDDLYTPDRLASVRGDLARSSVVVCWQRFLDKPLGHNRHLEGNVDDVILQDLVPHVGTVTLERSIVPCFDSRFTAGEDVEWWLRLAQSATVATTPHLGYLLRRHSEYRHRLDLAARIRARLLLLEAHRPYFEARPRAASFQWRCVGRMAMRAGDYGRARRAFQTALRLAPNLQGCWRLVRSAGTEILLGSRERQKEIREWP